MKLSPSPLSIALVAAQFTLIALLASPLRTLLPRGLADLPGSLCLLASVALAVWALVSMRAGTFAVVPEPRATARLVTRGPYARIRHPMYSAVLLFGLGAALTRTTAMDGVLCVLLLIVLLFKINREEQLLLERYPDYTAYRARTAALLPGVF